MNKLSREFTFADFKQALAFVNQVGELAEAAEHHPDIHLFYNKVTLEFWTHSAGAVTDKDLDLVKKVDSVFMRLNHPPQ